jgi:hypothetical protein
MGHASWRKKGQLKGIIRREFRQTHKTIDDAGRARFDMPARVSCEPDGGVRGVPKRLAILWVFSLVLSTSVAAQNINDLLRMFGGVMQQASQQAALAEWRKLPPPEVSCVDQNLRQQGTSVEALIRSGVLPSAPQLAQSRSICHSQFAGQSPSQPSFNCARARTPDELAICSNAELSQFDNAVAVGYEYLRQANGDAVAKQTNTPLFQARRVCGADIECIKARQIEAINTYHNLGAPVGTSLWNLNGSTMILLANGHSRIYFYEVPRSGMISAGASSGSLVFQGEVVDQQYTGTAYMFYSGCTPLPFHVQGPILDNYERVLLQGSAPKVGANCYLQGYSAIGLEFRLVKPAEISQLPTAPPSTQPDQSQSSPPVSNSAPPKNPGPPTPAPVETTDQRPRCETLIVARPYFVAECIAQGMAIKRYDSGLSDAKVAAEHEHGNLADCAADSLTKLQQMGDVSARKILNSGSITSLMDFSDAMKLECNKAANVIFTESVSRGN